jgi:hypothetical protein
VTVINGKLCKGKGIASQCLPHQFPFFKERCPEVISMYAGGTINVELEKPVRFLKYDFIFPKLKWHEAYNPETVALIKAGLLPAAERFKIPIPCFLYFAETSPHLKNPFKLEVITEMLDLAGVIECSIHICQPSREGLFFGLADSDPAIQ